MLTQNNIVLQAGIPVQFSDLGDFFRVMAANGTLDVEFFYHGQLVVDGEGVTAGYSEHFTSGQYDKIQITSAGGDNISFVSRLGNVVDYNKPPVGNVAVTNVPSVVVQAQPNQVIASFNYGAELVLKYGASHAINAALNALTPEAVFTPGQNINGAILHVASWTSESTSGGAVGPLALLVKNAPPVSVVDGDQLLSEQIFTYTSTYQWTASSCNRSIYIPSGMGLYFITGGTEGSGTRSALYTLL